MTAASKFAACVEGSWETAFYQSMSEIVIEFKASACVLSLLSYGHN